jgi:hypothetical protein
VLAGVVLLARSWFLSEGPKCLMYRTNYAPRGSFPDEEIGVTISDLREGRDLTLGAAEKAVRNSKS